jgi:hypothetical protein
VRSLAILTLILVAAAGCKKNPKPAQPDSPAPPVASNPNPPSGGNTGGGGNNVGIVPAGAVGVVTNPGGVTGGGGGGGAVQAVRKAARRAQALNEMKNLGEFIAQLQDPFGKMPTKEQILADLKRSAPAIHKAVEEGSYILTGTTEPGGLWAYEVDADKTPGIAVIGGRATRSTPDELAPYFRKN